MDEDGVIRIKPLGQPSYVHAYDPPRRGFAGDCVYAVQRHFVDCVLSGDSFESTAEDYLKTVRLVELAYESAATDRAIPVEPAAALSGLVEQAQRNPGPAGWFLAADRRGRGQL
jgi:hypothetical protein